MDFGIERAKTVTLSENTKKADEFCLCFVLGALSCVVLYTYFHAYNAFIVIVRCYITNLTRLPGSGQFEHSHVFQTFKSVL